jgi:hypothetical protein
MPEGAWKNSAHCEPVHTYWHGTCFIIYHPINLGYIADLEGGDARISFSSVKGGFK